jgi:cyclic pyranopterin phosphate synthase
MNNIKIVDSNDRPINYLRISVTDRCNFRCVYCQPEEGITLLRHEDILSYEEIVLIAQAAAELGISKIRLTGGEPLVRAGVSQLVKQLAAIKGIDDISLTTNGMLLKEYAQELKDAGLKRVNVSLDTLKPDRFEAITRLGKLAPVLEGIEAAREVGLTPVKINNVVIRGMNDDEIIDFARMTIENDWNVRFIELMPFVIDNPPEEHNIGMLKQSRKFMPINEIKEKLLVLGELSPSMDIKGNGPAKYYRFSHAKGTVGFISPISEHFCFQCNRIRLTADGKLRPCLLSALEVDMKPYVRGNMNRKQLKQKIIEAIKLKPRKHRLDEGSMPDNRSMSQVGG